MAYSDESDAILARMSQSLDFITAEHTRLVTAAWVRAWDDLAPELIAAVAEILASGNKPTRAELRKAQRLLNALGLVELRLAELADLSARSVVDQLQLIVDQGGHGTDSLIGSMLPPGETVDGWNRVNPGAVDAIIARTTEQITSRSYPLAADATAAVNRELVRGMLLGTNPRRVASRIVADAEIPFNGGLNRALVIARTEMLDAHRAAAALAEQANADTLAGWVWTSALTPRTCRSCWAKHGTLHELDEPGPLDHQCGRCKRVPKTKTWRELGFDIDEPESLLPDAEAAFNALSPAEQVDILGPAGYSAWRAGEFPMDAWTVKRETPDWRDSWTAAPPPAAFRGARRTAVLAAG